MALKNRLERLEKIRQGQPSQRIDIIEIHKQQEDGSEVIEVMDLRTAKPSEILAAADALIQDSATLTDEQRRALESISMVTHDA